MDKHYSEDFDWIVRGPRTKKAIIIAPDRSASPDEAVARLDLALDGFSGPVPAWFDFLHRTQNLPVYLLFMAIGATTAALLFPLEASGAAFIGIVAGMFLAMPVVKLADTLARRPKDGVQDVIREVAPLARTAHHVADLAATVIELDPASERETHRLTWLAASPDPAERRSGEDELIRRLAALDAEEAADYEELLKKDRD